MRGFWAELPENKHNNAPMNPRVYESEMPAFTTDVRMNKPIELFGSSAGHAQDASQAQGCGGGGPCEAVWWVKEAMVQWRMKGEAFVVGNDVESEDGEESSGVRTLKSEVGSRMRVVDAEKEGEWSWKRELTGHFGNNSPGLRGVFRSDFHESRDVWGCDADCNFLGTFKNPPPGQPVDKPYDDKNLAVGQKVEDLEDPVARANFRVVIIKPEEMESVDLSDPAKARRQVYKFDQSSGKWTHTECWP
jgi:pyridoxamine 5'-phosphate oxidase